MIRVGFGFWVAIACTALMGAELVSHRWWQAALSAGLAIGNLSTSHVKMSRMAPPNHDLYESKGDG